MNLLLITYKIYVKIKILIPTIYLVNTLSKYF